MRRRLWQSLKPRVKSCFFLNPTREKQAMLFYGDQPLVIRSILNIPNHLPDGIDLGCIRSSCAAMRLISKRGNEMGLPKPCCAPRGFRGSRLAAVGLTRMVEARSMWTYLFVHGIVGTDQPDVATMGLLFLAHSFPCTGRNSTHLDASTSSAVKCIH